MKAKEIQKKKRSCTCLPTRFKMLIKISLKTAGSQVLTMLANHFFPIRRCLGISKSSNNMLVNTQVLRCCTTVHAYVPSRVNSQTKTKCFLV